MSAEELPEKGTSENDALRTTRNLLSVLAEEAKAPDNQSAPAPTPDDKGWWRPSKLGKNKKRAETLVDETPLTRLCNAVLAFAIDQKASVVALTRSEDDLEVTFKSEATATQRYNLPCHLFESMVARYLMMAITPRSTVDEPFFHQIAIVHKHRNYTASVAITQEDEATVMTLRLASDAQEYSRTVATPFR